MRAIINRNIPINSKARKLKKYPNMVLKNRYFDEF